MERIQFGKIPKSYTQAIARLPQSESYLTKQNQSLKELQVLRRILEETSSEYECGKLLPLEERMFPLDLESIKFMEDSSLSFRRTSKEVFGTWTKIDSKSIWANVYDTDDDSYAYWIIHDLSPDHNEGLQLKCIETNLNCNSGNPIPETTSSTFLVGLVTNQELNELTNTLNRFANFTGPK